LTNWRAIQFGSLGCLIAAAVWYGGDGGRGLFVAAFAVGLAGVWQIHRDHPVLVDLPAMAVALLAACCMREGWWAAAVLLSVLAGTIKETSPVFAALWAWNPVLLAGLIAPAVRHFQKEGPDVLDAENRWILDHPIRASIKYHRHLPRALWVLPWGIGLAALAEPSWPLVAVLTVAYAQCVMATDTVRLYQWAWPVVALAAADAIPPAWWIPAIVFHMVNPFASKGG
jgi:hypothetical protein